MPRYRGPIWFDIDEDSREDASHTAHKVAHQVEQEWPGIVHNGTVPPSDDFRKLDPSEYSDPS